MDIKLRIEFDGHVMEYEGPADMSVTQHQHHGPVPHHHGHKVAGYSIRWGQPLGMSLQLEMMGSPKISEADSSPPEPADPEELRLLLEGFDSMLGQP